MSYHLDISQIAERYLGKPVVVQCYSFIRYGGRLASFNDDFVVLTNCTRLPDFEFESWQSKGFSVDSSDNEIEETAIRLSSIVLISCDADDLPAVTTRKQSLPPVFASRGCCSIKLGVASLDLVSDRKVEIFMKELDRTRNRLTKDLGFQIAPVHVEIELELEEDEYEILVHGTRVASDLIRPGKFLAIEVSSMAGSLPGTPAKDPVFGFDATWIDGEHRAKAATDGYTVVSATTVLMTHLSSIAQENRTDFFSYDTVCQSLLALRDTKPMLVKDFFDPSTAKRDLYNVLHGLLKENVWIGCFEKICEAVAMHRSSDTSVESLIDLVRESINRSLVSPILNEEGAATVILIEPKLEYQLKNAYPLTLEPLERLISAIRQRWEEAESKGQNAALLTDRDFRRRLLEMTSRSLSKMAVLGYSEIPKNIIIAPIGTIKSDEVFPEPLPDSTAVVATPDPTTLNRAATDTDKVD